MPSRPRSELHLEGHTDATIRAAVRTGSLSRVRRGWFVESDAVSDHTDLMRHRIEATAHAAGDSLVLSHDSAALIHGLGQLRPDRRHVHLTADRRGGGKRDGDRVVHAAPLSACDITSVDGLAVTSIARTAFDLACVGDLDQGVCVLDSALREGVTRVDLREVAARAGRRVGIASARRALEVSDHRSGSVLESWSRALIHRWPEIPPPELQREVIVGGRRFVADFDWDGRLVGEADGRIKYDGRFGDVPAEALYQEKLREDLIRGTGRLVCRWGYEHCRRPEELRALLVRALRLSGVL